MVRRASRLAALAASLSLVAGCGDTVFRIRTPVAFQSDRETRLIPRTGSPAEQSLPAAPSPIVAQLPEPTPVDRAVGLAAVPPAAAPLPLAASPGQGQGEGLKAEPTPAPIASVPQTLTLAAAAQQLANRYSIPALIEIQGVPDVTLTGEAPPLETALAGLLEVATPRHYGAIARSPSGTPVALIISPYPIIGARP